MQHERYLATGDVREEASEKTRSEMLVKVSEAPYEVREVYGEIHEPNAEEIYEVEGKIRQPYDEEYDEVYQAHKAVTSPAKRIVGMINAVEVDNTRSLPFDFPLLIGLID